MKHHPNLLRLRALLAAVVLASTTFIVQASPAEPCSRSSEALRTPTARALACASDLSFQGHLTNSSSSTAAATRSTTGNVYAYISKVVDNWSCTAYFRYDGIEWVRNSTATNGNFAWGNLINSTSVSCNWAVGSTDYVKGNSTTDCPDTDAEYARKVFLGYTDGSTPSSMCSTPTRPRTSTAISRSPTRTARRTTAPRR
ncbi:MAG: hypothetical protein U0838_05685 [Chloroflexota bacterium]